MGTHVMPCHALNTDCLLCKRSPDTAVCNSHSQTGAKPAASTVKKIPGGPVAGTTPLRAAAMATPASLGRPAGARTMSTPGSAPKAATPSLTPVLGRPGSGSSTPGSVATPTLVLAGAQSRSAGGAIPIAAMPVMPTSWNTPMAQMQQLPMDAAVSALLRCMQ
jgi:hypothetical protein